MTTIIVAILVVLAAASAIGSLVWVAASPLAQRNFVDTLVAVRWWMVPAGLANLAVVFAIIVGLTTWLPALRIGWWQLLGGNGNVLLGQTGNDGGWWRVAAIGIPALLFLAVPALAHSEEVAFRQGNETRSTRTRISRLVTFGLIHCVGAGVPVAAGVALIVSGAYFEQIYLRAVRRLRGEIEVAGTIPKLELVPSPSLPSGEYDPAEWARHRAEREAAWQENERRYDEWCEDLPEQAYDAVRREGEARRPAVAAAAAAHTISNWMAVTAIFTLLATGYL